MEVGSPEHNEEIKRRAERRFKIIDGLPTDIRAVVHEYGWSAVKELMDLGVTSAGRLRHIIRCCRNER